MKPYLQIEHLSRRYGKQNVLRDVNLSFEKKGMYILLGASGSGKSTLLNIIAGLDVGYFGKCRIGNANLKRMSEKARMRFRLKHIGYIFQSYELLELETSLRNVLLPLEALSPSPSKKKKRRGMDLLCFSDMKEKINQSAEDLSGGEKQRVSLSRALANDPEIILADEPSGALDEKNAVRVFSILKAMAKSKLVIVVTHDKNLAFTYADHILEIKDQLIQVKENLSSPKNKGLEASMPLSYSKKNPRLPFPYLFQHAFHLLKKKRFRSLLSISAICLGLVGLGGSLYLSNSIQDEISNAFDSIFPGNQIVMSPLDSNLETLSHISSASEEEVKSLAEAYPNQIKDYGVSYLCDFEENFKDANRAYIIKGYHEIELSSISIRQIGEYLWLDDYPDLKIYPRSPKQMSEDSFVLGLPYASMFNLCFGLSIIRSYESLGNYIYTHGLKLIFDLANLDWGYEDEQIFKVIGVTSTSVPTIYHLDHRWSSYVFEESMRMPSTDQQSIPIEAPWTMNKVYYLEAMKNSEEMIDTLREADSANCYIFERVNSNYDYTHCPLSGNCELERNYVYIADKSSVPFKTIQEVRASYPEISGCILTSNGSYIASPNSIINGLAYHFFISNDYDRLDQVIDAYSDVSIAEKDLDFSLPEKTFDLNYAKSISGGVKLSNQLDELEVKPNGEEEIALSTSLFEKLGKPSEISVAAEVSSSQDASRYYRNFTKAKLKVVSVKKEDKDIVYIPDNWTIDFFRDCLGMSSFYLEPTGAVIELNDKKENEKAISTLSQLFPEYHFSSPSEVLSDSIQTTSEYISFILGCFSFVSLIISLLLFVIVLAISIFENEREASMLYVLGISRNDIGRVFISMSLLLILTSFVLSSIGLLGLEVIVHYYIGASFSTSSSFSPSWAPFLGIGLVCFVFETLFAIVLKAHFGKKLFCH